MEKAIKNKTFDKTERIENNTNLTEKNLIKFNTKNKSFDKKERIENVLTNQSPFCNTYHNVCIPTNNETNGNGDSTNDNKFEKLNVFIKEHIKKVKRTNGKKSD